MKKILIILAVTFFLCSVYAHALIEVWTADDLNNVRNDLSGDYIQMANIDLNIAPYNEGEGWVPIGWHRNDYDNDPFTGSYDGNGFLIYDLFINRSDIDYPDEYIYPQGLFGASGNYASLSNIGLIDVDITLHLQGPGYGARGAGSLIGFGRTSYISNCHATGSLDAIGQSFANHHIGGLIGNNRGGSISGCWTRMSVTGGTDVGGLIGLATLTPISNSHASGTVYGTLRVGGLIGDYDQNYSMNNCYSEGTVTGESSVGGLVGANRASTIYNSYSRADVTGTGSDIGGFAGRSTVAAGIENCYSTGSVAGVQDVGGFVGWDVMTNFVNCYWDTETSGTTVSAGGEGRTTAEMTHPHEANTYNGWDFDGIWSTDVNYDINDGYPYLEEVTVDVGNELLIEVSKVTLTTYPNPFNPVTTIRFSYSGSVSPELIIYNIQGQKVLSVDQFLKDENGCFYIWNGRDGNNDGVSSGVYFVALKSEGKLLQTGKMLLVK